MVFDGTIKSDFLKYLPREVESKERFINFAASDFVTYKKALTDYVKATFPLDYNNFNESDFGSLLIELMAAVGHIQSHKVDYLAHENFITTARERASIKKLMQLIGIRMKGPIAAAANARLSFTTSTDCSGLSLDASQRTLSITSPQDGGSLNYTLYKVNSDGSIDITEPTTKLDFTFSDTTNPSLTSAVLLEGSFVVETGTFSNPDSLKSIRLSQGPYLERSAQVFIEGNPDTAGVYSEEDNIFFASGGDDKVFQIITDDNYNATLFFGDNTLGLSPAVGDSYTVTYRVGGGSRGNIPNSFINASINGTAKLVAPGGDVATTITVENISQGTGGAEAESIERVKRYGPLRFRSQDRLVTLSDYIAFANTFASNYGSTGKATAIVRKAYSSANNIDVIVLEKASDTQMRQATEEYKKQLLEAISEKKMITDDPIISNGLIRTLDLNITIKLDKKFKKDTNQIIARARGIVQNYFNVDNTEFGQAFSPQDLIRTILEEPQIRFATVDNIDSNVLVDYFEVIQLNNLSITSELI